MASGARVLVQTLVVTCEIPTGDTRSLDAGADFGLVAMHFGGVDVADNRARWRFPRRRRSRRP